MVSGNTLKKVLWYLGLASISFFGTYYYAIKLPEEDRKLITDMAYAGGFIACAGIAIICLGRLSSDSSLVDLTTIIGILISGLGGVLILSGTWLIHWFGKFESDK